MWKRLKSDNQKRAIRDRWHSRQARRRRRSRLLTMRAMGRKARRNWY